MFAGDIRVLSKCTMGCKVYLMCVRLMQNRMELFSTAAKLFVWHLRLRHKKHCNPIADTGYAKSKICFHYKYLGIVLDIELSDEKDIQRQLWCQYHAVNNCELLFLDVWTQWKMYFFVPSLRPCMHHNYAVISGRHTSTDCVWLITLVTELCRTCRGERVLVVIRFNVTFLPLRPIAKKCAPLS